MSLKPFFEWCDHTAVAQAIRDSRILFPLIECIHLLALTVLLGTVIALSLRMLGLALRSQPVPSVARTLAPLTLGSLTLMLLSGALLFASEALKCYENPPFFLKMELLFPAIAFHFTFTRPTAMSTAASSDRLRSFTAAIGSLILWFGVAAAGRSIGFY